MKPDLLDRALRYGHVVVKRDGRVFWVSECRPLKWYEKLARVVQWFRTSRSISNFYNLLSARF